MLIGQELGTGSINTGSHGRRCGRNLRSLNLPAFVRMLNLPAIIRRRHTPPPRGTLFGLLGQLEHAFNRGLIDAPLF